MMLAIRPPADSSAVIAKDASSEGKRAIDRAGHGNRRRQHERRDVEDPQDELPQIKKRRKYGDRVGHAS